MASTQRLRETIAGEGGAILIHVAIAILALTGMLAFVLDYGVMWSARRQAQNAADAGALASGSALIYDNFTDRNTTGLAYLSGLETAKANLVYNEVPGVVAEQSTAATGWTPDAPQTCKDRAGTCAQVSVFRDGTNGGSVLPVVFARVLGQAFQKVRATATVQLLAANANPCIKPWIVMDKGGSTYTLADAGAPLVLQANAGPLSYRTADFAASGADCPNGAAACYGDAMLGCIGPPSSSFRNGVSIWERQVVMTGPNTEGDAIWAQDPGASWNGTAVVGSCALTRSCACANAGGHGCANGLNGAISPRILAIALFDPAEVNAMTGSGPPKQAVIQNIAGVFMLQPGTGPDPICVADPNNFCGYLVPTPGSWGAGGARDAGDSLNVFLSLIR